MQSSGRKKKMRAYSKRGKMTRLNFGHLVVFCYGWPSLFFYLKRKDKPSSHLRKINEAGWMEKNILSMLCSSHKMEISLVSFFIQIQLAKGNTTDGCDIVGWIHSCINWTSLRWHARHSFFFNEERCHIVGERIVKEVRKVIIYKWRIDAWNDTKYCSRTWGAGELLEEDSSRSHVKYPKCFCFGRLITNSQIMVLWLMR